MKPEGSDFTDIPRPLDAAGQQTELFDLSLLLKGDALNIRRAAEADTAISVGDYFGLLLRFTELAPEVSGVLEQFAGNDFDNCKKGRKVLDKMIGLLEEMQCEEFIVGLRFLSGACQNKSDWSHAAAHAKQMKDGFNGACARVRAAKVILPQDAPDSGMPLEDCVNMLDQNDANRRLSVMVVDDSVDILRAVFLVLRRDYKVYPVPDSTQLEEVLRHITPDLFLLDYSMPQINGLELIPIIREFPEHEDTPIIILTGVGTKDRLAAAVLLGVCDFLDKPVQADMLRRKIGEHIAKKNI